MTRRAFLAGTVAASAVARVPVLAELYTSEGCSSCPPADAVLARLLREQPVPGARILALSEHVDYWNHNGWRDPFSSAQYSQRQQSYGERFRLDSVYTPQLVIDGAIEVLGSDWKKAIGAVEVAARRPKVELTVTVHDGTATVEVGACERAGLWLAIASDAAESSVTRGENAGRRLAHVMVARSLEKIGETNPQAGIRREVRLKGPGTVIAFVQERGQGRVSGAAMG